MRSAELGALLALALLPSVARAQGAPLDVTDPTPRAVLVQVEHSPDLAIVGQSFGPPFPATWSVSGNTGTLTISAETHEHMDLGDPYAWPPVPGFFSPIVIEIDLTSLHATSQFAYGSYEEWPYSLGIVHNPLGTATTGGFTGPTVPPLFCVSQQQVDQMCLFYPQFCGQTCTLVPGSAYDPGSGRINLIGSDTLHGCDGGPGSCFDPPPYFCKHGDLRLTEAAEVPALPGVAPFALLAALLLGARAVRGR